MSWRPITDLPENHADLASEELARLGELWREQAGELSGSGALRDFTTRLQREWAIETGLIERLYTLDRGITQLLVEQGIDAALIPHRGAGGRDPEQVAALMRDQLDVAEGLFAFVRQDRHLSAGYVKELHAALTRNQETTTAMTPDGCMIEVSLRRGIFKESANNPTRPDGTVHEYAPAEQVASEVDRLVAMHLAHEHAGVAPEVSAAWLHHRFAQIHPFQDGNGRVARALATLVFLRAGMFPPVVRDDADRSVYIRALEEADAGNLGPLIALLARIEKAALLGAIGLSNRVMVEQRDMRQLIAALGREAQMAEQSGRVEWASALELAGAVQRHAFERMNGVRRDLLDVLSRADYRVYADTAGPDHRDAAWYRHDVIAVAHEFDYLANLEAYRGWCRLKLMSTRDRLQDELVVGIHGLGREFRGGVAAVAFSIRREQSDDSAPRETRRVVLTDQPFSLTYRESEPVVVERFARWLEPALLAGIDGFRRAVANGA